MGSSEDGGITAATAPTPPAITGGLSRISLVLRSLLFAATGASIAVMVTGKQTKEIISLPPFPPLVMVAKFDYSPSFMAWKFE
ncbi:hypothetical protein KSP40_PGU018139 [Platanthera guangdongensis]|uniref:CASP-like protein n=1 Tax=Platanthera guangdongensis TaxID=2320717 RepID=A0ABR2MUX2_9ASPA